MRELVCNFDKDCNRKLREAIEATKEVLLKQDPNINFHNASFMTICRILDLNAVIAGATFSEAVVELQKYIESVKFCYKL